jgi:hypothetical protein
VKPRLFTVLLPLLAVALPAADPAGASAPPASASAKLSYEDFIKQAFSAPQLDDFIAWSDRLVNEDEAPGGRDLAGIRGFTTKLGLRLEFGRIMSKEAIIVDATLSRGGDELKYSDAVKLIALFADRAGLPHPIDVREGERPVFHAQWLIKPGDWKKIHEMMLKRRDESRQMKDPVQALAVAVSRELEARRRSGSKRP